MAVVYHVFSRTTDLTDKGCFNEVKLTWMKELQFRSITTYMNCCGLEKTATLSFFFYYDIK